MVDLPLWKIWKSNGKDDIPYIMENKTCLKPPTREWSSTVMIHLKLGVKMGNVRTTSSSFSLCLVFGEPIRWGGNWVNPPKKNSSTLAIRDPWTNYIQPHMVFAGPHAAWHMLLHQAIAMGFQSFILGQPFISRDHRKWHHFFYVTSGQHTNNYEKSPFSMGKSW